MVNTKKLKASYVKRTPAQSHLSGGRGPGSCNIKKIKEVSERASLRAEGRVGPKGTSLIKKEASERASLRAVREQQSVDVAPVIHGQWWDFADVGQQTEDRGASIKFYGPRRAVLGKSN